MRRRDVVIAFLGTATSWSLGARAQQAGGTRRIGVLMPLAADDPEGQARISTFREALQGRGWVEGRNLRIDLRWGAGEAVRNRQFAEELVALGPDVLLAGGGLWWRR